MRLLSATILSFALATSVLAQHSQNGTEPVTAAPMLSDVRAVSPATTAKNVEWMEQVSDKQYLK